MFIWLLQLLDFLIHQRAHAFFIFFIFVWTIWLIKCYYARKNTHVFSDGNFSASASVVIPVLKEKPDLFRKSLSSVVDENPTEVFVVFDADARDVVLETIARSSFPNVKVLINPIPNKREAFACGARRASGDLIIELAIDTIYPKGWLKKVVEPFQNPRIGGVTLNQRVSDPGRTLARKIADWWFDLRFKIPLPALSSKGVLHCMTGELLVVRRNLLIPHLDEFLHEKCGRGGKGRYILGDDRFITSFLVLRKGYDVILRTVNEPVYTDCPDTLIGLCKQQLRWFRSYQRYHLKSFKWMFQRSKMLSFHIIASFIVVYGWMFIVALWILNSIFHFDPLLIIEEYTFLRGGVYVGLSIIGWLLSVGIRQVPHLKDVKKDLKFLPLFALFVTFIIPPLSMYGLLTPNKQVWLTRGMSKERT